MGSQQPVPELHSQGFPAQDPVLRGNQALLHDNFADQRLHHQPLASNASVPLSHQEQPVQLDNLNPGSSGWPVQTNSGPMVNSIPNSQMVGSNHHQQQQQLSAPLGLQSYSTAGQSSCASSNLQYNPSLGVGHSQIGTHQSMQPSQQMSFNTMDTSLASYENSLLTGTAANSMFGVNHGGNVPMPQVTTGYSGGRLSHQQPHLS